MKPDFSGYASRADVECADGLTILAHAFKDKHGKKVPIVWQHNHDDPELVLGHALVEDRKDGTYVYGFLNDAPKGKVAKTLLKHGDVESLSIYANRLLKRGKEVVHGVLHEVSLVLSGANPGAGIDFVALQHSDGTIEDSETEAIIHMDIPLEYSGNDDQGDNMSDTDTDMDNNAIYHSMTGDQKKFLHSMIEEALSHADDDEDDLDDEDDDDKDETTDESNDSDDNDNDSDDDEDDDQKDVKHAGTSDQENNMTHRVFDQGTTGGDEIKHTALTADQIQTIMHDAFKSKGSVKDSFLKHAGDYGINNIDLLFPDAKAIDSTPEFLSRRMEWVKELMTKVRSLPYSRIKTLYADITADEARAKGYVTGTEKKEEVFGLLRRITTPTTIYKKQKVDRDDILDATEINLIAWLKAEMRLMLEEEIARAILLGDGRDVMDEDKIKDPTGSSNEGSGIRSIANDHGAYAHVVTISSDADVDERIEAIIRSRGAYRGSGSPTMFTTLSFLTDMRLVKDKMGRRIYAGDTDLATDLLVSKIVDVEPMEGHEDIVAIVVNPSDYSVGTDRGGQISFFEDFDIDFNQQKMLLETRMSGALHRLKSAIIIKVAEANSTEITTLEVTSDEGLVALPDTPGVTWSINGVDTSDSTIDLSDYANGSEVFVAATANSGYHFGPSVQTTWTFYGTGA